MASTLDQLGEEAYIAVTSYRRDGTPVSTPVWTARDGDSLVVWTVGDSYKVKRIRKNPSVTVAPCTIRGVPTGEAVPASAVVLEQPEGGELARGLIKKKYGVRGRLTVFFSVMRRGADASVGLRITLT